MGEVIVRTSINSSVMIINIFNVQEIRLQEAVSAGLRQKEHQNIPSSSHPHREVLCSQRN
jgi:hypothetical protein